MNNENKCDKYESFFVFTMFATIPALLITYFVPFTYPDEKK